ncbi:MAG TPA: aldo/keto reductase [Anaeromyxobacteraceae bacterium]|nr:aldo/keto reductase [Anaeromyxobacteraceae bacterium]
MKYRPLGDTGVFVSELCLGTMTFGGSATFWTVIGGLDQGAATALVRGALDAGVNFVDTADVYGGGDSETMVGRALEGRRHDVVLATKVRGRTGPGPNQVGLSRLHIVEAAEASLRRLGTDYIDLYQIHRADLLTNLEDTLRALDDLVRAGKVRYVGCSNLDAWVLMKSLGVSRAQNLERFRASQSYYSLVGRELERDTVPLLRDQGLGLLVWSPLAGGLLSGKFTRTGGDPAARRAKFDFPPVDREKGFQVLDVLSAVAARQRASIAQVAIAWLLARDFVTSVIIGARSPAQLADNLKAVDVVLTAEDLHALDEASKPPLSYPGWMETLGSDRRPGERRY